MSESIGSQSVAQKDPRLADAIREVKNAIADRADVVVELRHAQRTRLELLAEDLTPVFAQAGDDDRFDFAISQGEQPRLWIDAVAHVTMGRDRRTYRFLRDTRLGRVVLAESSDMKPVSDAVTRYIAERLIERRQALEDDAAADVTLRHAAAAPADHPPSPLPAFTAANLDAQAAVVPETVERKGPSVLRSLGLLLLGLLIGAAIIAVVARDRLGELGIDLDALGF